MNYPQSIKYLESFQKSGIRLGLERITSLLKELGDPQNNFRSIHVAGTNGKGSVAAMLSSILNQSGYRTGLYTSPHLVDYTERVRINEKDISRRKFANAIERVQRAIRKLPQMGLTEFEVLTAAAFLLFKQERIDVAVIEVGLGGRLDATNVITPVISVITNIDYDHIDVLGDTIEKIAREKAGIIKPGIPLVTGEDKVWQLLRDECKKRGSRFIRAKNRRIKSAPLPGEHQKENVSIVLAVMEELGKRGIKASKVKIENGLKLTHWPGRLQIVNKDPLTILDGAHNPAGARALCKYLSGLHRKVNFIIGMQSNKDIGRFARIIAQNANNIYAVRSSHPGAEPARTLARRIKKSGGKVVISSDIDTAIAKAGSGKFPICITGSLYLVGDVLSQKRFDL